MSPSPPPPPHPPLLEAIDVSKEFGSHRALDAVSFSLRSGECLALFGANGAGKSTLMAILAQLMRPTSGRVRLSGVDLEEADETDRQRFGVLSHEPYVYAALTVRENLRLFSRLHGISGFSRAAELCEPLGLTAHIDRPTRELSRGLQQRLALGRTLLHDPECLLLDEPFSGLDEAAVVWLTAWIERARSGGKAILLTTHRLEEGLVVATRAAILRHGEWIHETAQGALDRHAFRARYREAVGIA